MSVSILSFGHLFTRISLLGTYRGVEPMGHRVFERSASVDTDNNFLKSFWVHAPTGRAWKLQLLRIFPILGIDRFKRGTQKKERSQGVTFQPAGRPSPWSCAQEDCHRAQAWDALSQLTSSQGCGKAEGPGGERVLRATMRVSEDLRAPPESATAPSVIPSLIPPER